MCGSDGLPNEELNQDQAWSGQSALISQSPLWFPALGRDSSTPCSPKAEDAHGFHYPPLPPFHCPSSSLSLHANTHTFTIHTHTGLSFESLEPDLKFLFGACHAFYMHGEWERGGIEGGKGGARVSAVGSPRDISVHTTITTFFCSSPLIFSHPLSSFNISFTASCLAQILPSSERAAAFEDKCDQSRGREGAQNLAAGHLGFLHSCLAAYGAEKGGWQCLGTALMSDRARLLLLTQSFTRRLLTQSGSRSCDR